VSPWLSRYTTATPIDNEKKIQGLPPNIMRKWSNTGKNEKNEKTMDGST
jgi:hypothetical protein